nr:unnamed protein product [Digitaria exilis]
MESSRGGSAAAAAEDAGGAMPSFGPPQLSIHTDMNSMQPSRVTDFGALAQSAGFRIEDLANLNTSTLFNLKPAHTISNNPLQFGSYGKAYIQNLESSRLKLTQLEQELQRARQQGMVISTAGNQPQSTGGNGALAFDMEYARWLEEHNKHVNELRAAVNAHAGDNDLRGIVDSIMGHYDEIFRLKGVAAKADVFHVLSGMWKTPAERCFMWLGGFRSSELLKLLACQLEPLTDQQLVGISNLQQSSQQAEDALSQGMEALQQSLAETLASGSLGPAGSSGNVANYMGQMAMAMGKLGTLENFLRQRLVYVFK